MVIQWYQLLQINFVCVEWGSLEVIGRAERDPSSLSSKPLSPEGGYGTEQGGVLVGEERR